MQKKYFIFITLLISLNIFASITPAIPKIETDCGNFTNLVALFGLGIVSILALFLSSSKIKYFQQQYKEKEKREDKIKQSQDAMLSKIGENINTIAQETTTNNQNTTKSEKQLLAITTNLIDFLRIKSNKIQIVSEKIKLSHLLNDVSGILKSNIKSKNLELIYDIKNDISEEITSDTLRMSKILVNILLYCIENNSKIITLQIAKNSLISKNDQLFFTINSHIKIDVESGINIFKSNYNEITEEYDSLGLFIARELSLLMNGDLIARNDNNGNLEFVFNIPYFEEEQEKINTKNIKNKNILVIDSVEKSATNLKKTLESLGNLVKVINPQDFLSNLNYFDMYELLLLDEKLFTNKVVSKLEDTNIKIISIGNIFQESEKFPNSKLADLKISKPLTLWQISDALSQVENHNFNLLEENKDTIKSSGNILVHRNSFQETRDISLSNFIKFEDKKVLLVEDNVINQKVFTGVLKKSKMQVSVANHGKEALKILSQNKDIDIIIMDINMPVIDGYTASIKIREDKQYDDIPIIALSALTSNDEVSKMFASGMNGYLSKPLKKEQLFTVFSMYLKNTKPIQEKQVKRKIKRTIEIYGLNIALGISKSSSSKIFYKEILLEFKDAYGEIGEILEKLVNDCRYEQLKIICVDLRGLTGTIGAEILNRIVIDILEKLALKKYEVIPKIVQNYKEEAKLLNDSIDTYLN